MTTVVDLPTALDLLRKAVEAKGAQHRQYACYYVTSVDGHSAWYEGAENDGDKPAAGCIVGQAVWNLVGESVAVQNFGKSLVNGNVVTDEKFTKALADAGYSLTDDALYLWDTAQQYQDGRWNSHVRPEDINPDDEYAHETTGTENLPWSVAVQRAHEDTLARN